MSFKSLKIYYNQLRCAAKKRIKLSIAWFLIAFFAAVQLLILAVIILSTRTNTKNTSVETNSTTFALYKNTRFEECLNNTTQPVNYILLQNSLATSFFDENKSQTHDCGFLLYTNYSMGDLGPIRHIEWKNETFSWCALASCFAGAKILPTTPRLSAFNSTGLIVWCWTNIAMLSSVWALKKQISYGYCTAERWAYGLPSSYGDDYDVELCESLGILDWLFIAFDVVQVIFWWIWWGMLVADPQSHARVSIMLCITTLRYATCLYYRPYACQFSPGSPWKRIFIGVLSTAATVHWIATLYLLWLKLPDITGSTNHKSLLYPKYECLGDQVAAAPGTSSCTPQELCNKEWLRSDPGFQYGTVALPLMYTIGFMLTIMPIMIFFVNLVRAKLKLKKDYRNIHQSNFIKFAPLIPGMFLTLGALGVLISYGWNLDGMNREATVAYDLNCSVVHISLSPGQNYLDVDMFGRTLRIVKMWFSS
ncbi:MAG: hypothetical protein LQ342_007962 [Letrouitia transgressa]|nr:MAG: hypothetical protein LQ342_007962 [Letrouitia transgressa]